MFQIGDMVRDKKAVGPNNIIYYGIVTYVEAEDNPYDLSLIKVEWLNWEGGGTMPAYQTDAQKWWVKVEG
jgi:hypothetical protein